MLLIDCDIIDQDTCKLSNKIEQGLESVLTMDYDSFFNIERNSS